MSGVRLLLSAGEADRFTAKIDVGHPLGCWLWAAGLSHDGYARFQLRGRAETGHRIAYRWLRGSIPAGLELDHLCRVRHCVNPDHLQPVTRRTNVERGASFAARNARKMHCVNGHPFDRDNTRRVGSQRSCWACIRDANARQSEAREFKPWGRSGYRGVSWHKASGKWSACIRLEGTLHHLGLFADERAAAEAFDAAAIAAGRDPRRLNFPQASMAKFELGELGNRGVA